MSGRNRISAALWNASLFCGATDLFISQYKYLIVNSLCKLFVVINVFINWIDKKKLLYLIFLDHGRGENVHYIMVYIYIYTVAQQTSSPRQPLNILHHLSFEKWFDRIIREIKSWITVLISKVQASKFRSQSSFTELYNFFTHQFVTSIKSPS